MKYKIDYVNTFDDCLLYGLDFLPNQIRTGLLSFIIDKKLSLISEIRMIANNKISILANTLTFNTDITITKSELVKIFKDEISDVTIQRTLNELVKKGDIIKIGGGRYTSYTWNRENEK